MGALRLVVAVFLFLGAATCLVLPVPRFDFDAVSLNGKAYFIGGMNAGSASNRVDIYDDATSNWATSTVISVARNRAGIAASDDAVFVVGGTTSSAGPCTSATVSNAVDILYANGTQVATTISQARCDITGIRAGRNSTALPSHC